ncbi:MAG: hypothetical protein DRI57_28830 [Deltaproteobacteria bacterium]|nr:MAG: hypothetical protein DRI57_28830 [Deltaproteobacteria bacterium]
MPQQLPQKRQRSIRSKHPSGQARRNNIACDHQQTLLNFRSGFFFAYHHIFILAIFSLNCYKNCFIIMNSGNRLDANPVWSISTPSVHNKIKICLPLPGLPNPGCSRLQYNNE